MIQKIKMLKFNRYAWLGVLIVEILLGAFYFVQSKQEKAELNFSQEDLLYDSGESGFYLDKSYEGMQVVTPEFTLSKGLYTIDIEYEFLNEEVVRINFEYADGGINQDVSGPISLADSHRAVCDFRVKYSDRPMVFRARLSGNSGEKDYIIIRNIHISSAAIAGKNLLFSIIVFFIFVDGLLFLYMQKDKLCLCGETQTNCKILVLLILFCSIPLMVNYLMAPDGQDLKFHLTRIEGIKEALLNGMFPVKIQQGWLNGHGYAASVFYGDILLYIPAIFRIFGVSIQTSYKFYVLLIHALTVLLSYHCFSKMSNARIGLICTILYSLNLYRLNDIYTRGAVGEYTAITFMPLVLYGLWKVYMLPEESKEHNRSWVTITFGCTGIFLSHMISTEMTAFFVILTAVIFWKKTFRKKTMLVLFKSVAVTLLLNLWFLIPFLDYMISGTYVINHPNANYRSYWIERRGAFFAQFFMNDFLAMSGAAKNELGVASTMSLTVGLACVAVMAGWLIFCMGKKERSQTEKKEEYLAVFLCILSLWMSTYTFPYTTLVNKFPILKMPIRSLQFPWRFLTIAGVMLPYLLCIILKKEWIGAKRKLFAGVLVGLSLWQGLSYMSSCLQEGEVYRIEQAGGLSTFDIVSGEYLPMDELQGIDGYVSAYEDQLTYDTNVISIEDWRREKGAVVVSLTNLATDTQQIEVPLLLYKGYHAITDSGQELSLSPGESYRIAVDVPAGFSGSFKVAFKEPWYWRVCEGVSLMAAVGIAFYLIGDRKKGGKKISFSGNLFFWEFNGKRYL
ncbi:MAG: hypothetical protein NC318_11095 [Blautia sp.]|nr:hypothetical protein [Lachnoclostridium sp.]MCM1212138.1 hypothetical protein [Blautia sp.]